MSRLCALLVVLLIIGCTKQEERPITIALNPWPGYEFLHLAQSHGYFKAVGLNAEIVLMDSLSDVQRAYIHGRVDGFASTVIEAVQAHALSNNPLNIVLVPDYSNGGDVIIASEGIDSVQALKGKRVGCEVSSLGIYILARALHAAGMTLADVEVVNTEQGAGLKAMRDGTLDAFITYPPVSLEILKLTGNKIIFSSAEIPYDIIDTVSISKAALAKHPDFVEKLIKAWQMAYDYWQANPIEAVSFMAAREGISPEEFNGVLGDIEILSAEQQTKIFSAPDEIEERIRSVCDTLVRVETLSTDCRQLPSLIYRK